MPRRDATSLYANHGAWEDLEKRGFTLTHQLQAELVKPHLVGLLFDTQKECLDLVKSLHGTGVALHLAGSDADILFEWCAAHKREFEVDRREDRQRALKYRISKVERVSAPDAYDELLAMDVKLQARVSKARYRLQVRNPGVSKTELDNAAREQWLTILVGYVEEADLPIVKVANSTSSPADVIRRAFGSRRMKTLRNRARAWAKEESTKGRILESAAALAVMEGAGQVARDMRISLTPLWLQSVKSRIAELEQSDTKTKRAPPPTVAMLLSLELTVMSVGSFTDYFRAMAWLILLCTWACLRLSDLEGLVPNRLELGSRGLRGILVRTKTTGPGKHVREVPIYVSRKISLSGLDWMRCGYDIWKNLGFENRDYFVLSTNAAMDRVIHKFAPVERVAVYIRRVFMGLRVACKPRYQGWKLKENEPLLDKIGVMYFTGHSMRHFLPTVAAAIQINKEQRDYVGRWHVHLHQSADYIHSSRQIVTQVQEAVNQAIVEAVPSSYDESELIEDLACFLTTKGRVPAEWIKQHGVWRTTGEKIMIGGKWPGYFSLLTILSL
eukprot:s3525_g2.t1